MPRGRESLRKKGKEAQTDFEVGKSATSAGKKKSAVSSFGEKSQAGLPDDGKIFCRGCRCFGAGEGASNVDKNVHLERVGSKGKRSLRLRICTFRRQAKPSRKKEGRRRDESIRRGVPTTGKKERAAPS